MPSPRAASRASRYDKETYRRSVARALPYNGALPQDAQSANDRSHAVRKSGHCTGSCVGACFGGLIVRGKTNITWELGSSLLIAL
jgi:hypothetical protein